jgi:hypothetical protein
MNLLDCILTMIRWSFLHRRPESDEARVSIKILLLLEDSKNREPRRNGRKAKDIARISILNPFVTFASFCSIPLLSFCQLIALASNSNRRTPRTC